MSMNESVASTESYFNKIPQQTFGTTVVSFHPPEIRALFIELMHYHKDLVAKFKEERASDLIPDQENVWNVIKQLATEFNIILDGLYDHIDAMILAEKLRVKLVDRRIAKIQIGPTNV